MDSGVSPSWTRGSIQPVQRHRGPPCQCNGIVGIRFNVKSAPPTCRYICSIARQRRRFEMFTSTSLTSRVDMIVLACDKTQIKIVTRKTYCKTQNFMACSDLTRGADVSLNISFSSFLFHFTFTKNLFPLYAFEFLYKLNSVIKA